MSENNSNQTTTSTLSTQNHVADSILLRLTDPQINENTALRSQLRGNPHAALSYILHLLMVQRGFRLVGLSESDPVRELEEGDDGSVPPNQWTQSHDVYSFKYKHSQSAMTFVLKCVVLGDRLLIHALALEDKKPYAWEMNVDEFVDSDELNKSDCNLVNVYKKLDHIETLFKLNIMNKLVPFLNKDGYEQSSTSVASSSSSSTSATVTSGQRQRISTEDEDMDFDPYGPDAGRFHDPLRIGRPNMRPSPLMEGRPMYGGVGRSDLVPDVGAPYFRGGPASGFPGPYGGGSMVGPGHPMFGGGGGMGIPRPGAGGFPARPPSVPYGARFDPYGPPGTGGGVPPNRPNPDNLRPPTFDDDDVNPYFF